MGTDRMGRKLLLILALGVLGAIVAAGAGVASGGLLDSSKTGVSVNLPGGQNLPPVNALPPCPCVRREPVIQAPLPDPHRPAIARHGGQRERTPDSDHHAVDAARVEP